MKVSVLTLPLWNNYGGILQAYALTLTLNRLGHDVIFLDVKRNKLKKPHAFIQSLRRWLKNKVLSKAGPYYPNQTELEFISSKTRNFVEKKIQPSSGWMQLSELPEFSRGLDAIIVGSDQVWRPEYCPSIEFYFLGFAPKNIRKISYAASLGTDDWRFSDQNTLIAKNLLQKFNNVSVREKSAVDLIRDNLEVSAVQCCDPTLLLDTTDYLNIADISNMPSGGAGLFCYILDPEESRMQGLENIGASLGYPIFYNMPKTFNKYFAKDPEAYVFPKVESWIECFQKSDFVVTDSFHGCVFSIIFNKPFIAIANIDRGYTRFESLLEIYNLKDRLFKSISDIDPNILKKEINWDSVNITKAQQKQYGIDFLKKALAEV
ncbi:polysaccharide pyruvyl transferase family protein [Acinetobacter radioresistens]|uniref:polysaccharide pyruvyl transferase family protein n=1 Tax=Acinetobacter radioresistens TaxID=40216 RepID=UPI0021CDB70C|nr:polysaccharide pyruvyl transferase family protein [Acinetobacter radioresistens]MCU4499501.1 polysaccharide pyruvyl transferase family protein [Acinetobacter radioresistens]